MLVRGVVTLIAERLKYFASSAIKALDSNRVFCPSCGCRDSHLVEKKYVVTSLRRCCSCGLMYRSPTDSEAESFAYYQEEYESGMTTDVPVDAELSKLLDSDFKGTPKNFDRYIQVLNAIGIPASAKLLDFGCSWGYGTWQLQQAGYNAIGFELSGSRAGFAREKMGIDVLNGIDDVPDGLDIVFTAHVLEHIPQLQKTLERIFSWLRPGGLLVGITPNGSSKYRTEESASWSRSWGQKHPLLLDDVYWRNYLRDNSYYIGTRLDDEQGLGDWRRHGGVRQGSLAGPELLVVARKEQK